MSIIFIMGILKKTFDRGYPEMFMDILIVSYFIKVITPSLQFSTLVVSLVIYFFEISLNKQRVQQKIDFWVKIYLVKEILITQNCRNIIISVHKCFNLVFLQGSDNTTIDFLA